MQLKVVDEVEPAALFHCLGVDAEGAVFGAASVEDGHNPPE
jgi:hypothetical protein